MTLNGYYTKWMDRCDRDTQKRGQFNGGPMNGEYFSMSLENVSAQHIGLELDFAFNPTPPALEIQGMFSWGDWKWLNNPKGYYYNEQGQPLASLTDGTLASGTQRSRPCMEVF